MHYLCHHKTITLMKHFLLTLSVLALTLLSGCTKEHSNTNKWVGSSWRSYVAEDLYKVITINSTTEFSLYYTDLNGEPVTYSNTGKLVVGDNPDEFPVFSFEYIPYYLENIHEYSGLSYANAFVIYGVELLVQTAFMDSTGRYHELHYEQFQLWKK